MILYSARVENYKGIRGPIEITFDADSPNVVDGPNGVGKSTLLDAVLCCLVEGYNTAGAAAEQMRPRETALTPSIAVVFGHGGSIHRISKTFLDSPKSLLERKRADGVFEAIAKGKTADEEVRTLLRSSGGRSKEKPGERLGLLSVLCSTQGGQELPALSGDALTGIREMLGAQVSGAQGIAFERAVDKKYFSLWTPTGKPKAGKLTSIQESLVRARGDVQQCSAVLQQAVEFEASARAKRALHQETLDQLGVARAEYHPLADAAQQVLELRSRRTPALSRVEAATARYDQLRAEIDRIHDAAKKKRDCEEARPRARGIANERQRDARCSHGGGPTRTA